MTGSAIFDSASPNSSKIVTSRKPSARNIPANSFLPNVRSRKKTGGSSGCDFPLVVFNRFLYFRFSQSVILRDFRNRFSRLATAPECRCRDSLVFDDRFSGREKRIDRQTPRMDRKNSQRQASHIPRNQGKISVKYFSHYPLPMCGGVNCLTEVPNEHFFSRRFEIVCEKWMLTRYLFVYVVQSLSNILKRYSSFLCRKTKNVSFDQIVERQQPVLLVRQFD